MRILIYSDVHGNLPAFEEMLKVENQCDGYICLGDLVNYGPWSNECVELASSLPNSILLMGNHEEAFISGIYPGNNELVKEFFNYNIKDFTKICDIKKFISEYDIGKYTCKHTLFNKYIYPDTDTVLDGNYIIGHSHHQFEYKQGDFTLYNAGSVGQNRKYIDVANYLIYDAVSGLIELKYLVFDVDFVINEMRARKFPEICLNYYLQKRRYTNG